MIHRIGFVNCLAYLLSAFAWQILSFSGSGWSQEPNPDSPQTEYFRQAVEKIGPSSKLVWSQPGESSLNRWQPLSQIEVHGVVVSWDPEKLVIIKPDGNGPTNFPGDFVVGVEPSWKSSGYAQVHELFGQHRFREVLQQGQAALAQADVPRWQQRVLVALMVDSAVALKQHAVAGRVFKALAAESPPDLLLSRIPIPWSDELIGVTPTVTKEALAWIESDTPAMQLLGASWLTGGEHRLAAIDKLKVLSTNSSSLISSYAKVQLWRVVPPEEILSERFQEWTQQRDALPLPLQAGPTMLLAHRLAQANQSKLAVAEWLRIASLHSDRYHLADQAKNRATELATKTGDAVFAKKIEAAFAELSPPVKDPVGNQ